MRHLISQQELDHILKNLIDDNIIECDNYFVIGEKSKGYRIINKKSYKWKLEELHDANLVNKVEKRRMDVEINIANRGLGYKAVAFWTDYLEIDYVKAKKYVDNHFRKSETIFESGKASITLIKNKQFFKTVDNTSYRFHSNLTNIPTPLRKFLTINGEKLYNVDIKCSQPTFLGLLMKKQDGIDPKELETYLEICRQGQFYEYMAEQGSLDLDLTDYETRKYFKEKIFSGCLFDVNRSEYSKWEKIFQNVFPTIFRQVREIKKEKYNTLAIMLQKEETEFIFKIVSRLYTKLNKSIPLLTIHDSIVSNEIGIAKILPEIQFSFREVYRYNPKLEIAKL